MKEQTESMIDTKEQRFRLIKDGKPIGYVIIDTIYYDGFHGAVYATDLQGDDFDEVPDFDTFDRGFEFGEGDKVKWIFEGDKVEITHNTSSPANGIIIFKNLAFKIQVINSFFNIYPNLIASITVTGNIYEGSNKGEIKC